MKMPNPDGGVHINKADTGTDKSTTDISMKIDGVQTTFTKGSSANTNAQITYDLSKVEGTEKYFQTWLGIDYIKSGKTGRDGAKFFIYKEEVAEENMLYESGVIKQADEAKFVNLDVSDVNKLILVADEVENKNDDCVDWADAKLYVKLRVKADKTELQSVIAEAEEKVEADYTAETWKTFADALAEAQRINADKNAEQTEVDNATKVLQEAMNNLKEKEPEFVEADKTELQSVIAEAEKKMESDYTAETWKTFADALSEAQRVNEDKNAEQTEVDNATKVLQEAMNNLKEKEPEFVEADKTELQLVIAAEAEKKVEADYTVETWKTFAEAFAEAQRVNADKNASQEDVNSAMKNLQSAMEELQKKPAKVPEGENGTDKPNVNENTNVNTTTKPNESEPVKQGIHKRRLDLFLHCRFRQQELLQ